MLTASILRAAIPLATPSSAERFARPLAEACAEFGIDTPARLAAFLAQVAHESGNLGRLVESLNYSAQGLVAVWPRRFTADTAAAYARHPEQIANLVYAERMGNGDLASGDGWRYRGRGLIQVTGRANYAACGKALGLDLVGAPELLEQPEPAARSAAWFWRMRNLNPMADRGDIEGITKAINGGLTGLADRKERYAAALASMHPETASA